MERLKSKVVWIAIIAQTIIILNIFGIAPEIIKNIEVVSASILSILVILGILNNPTDKENF